MLRKKIKFNVENEVVKAVLYMRYSSLNQNEQSIEGQRHACQAYCKANNYVIIDEYIDRALSGTSDNRPNFQRMIKDSAKGYFDKVIVYKVDRFGRDRYDIATYKRKLKQNGVKLEYAEERIPEGPEGIMLEAMLEGMSEYYSADLSQKIKRGVRESALKFKMLSHPPFGYEKDKNGCYKLNEATAPLAREIFDKYINGVPSSKIVESLNARGIKTTKGTDFETRTIPKIISNPRYAGIYVFKNGEMWVENAIPAIVTKEEYERGLKMLETNKHKNHSTKVKIPFLLTDKLYCGICGDKMTGDSGTGRHGGKHYYYTCVSRKTRKGCIKKSIRRNEIEEFVTELTVRCALKSTTIKQIADTIMEIQEKGINTSVLDSLKLQLKEVNTAIKNIIDVLQQGIIMDSVKERLMELEEKQRKLKAGIQIEQNRLNNPKYDKQSVMNWLASFKEGDTKNKKFQNAIIDVFINKIFLYEDEINIVYNYTNDNSLKISLDDVKKIIKNSEILEDSELSGVRIERLNWSVGDLNP